MWGFLVVSQMLALASVLSFLPFEPDSVQEYVKVPALAGG